MLDPINNPLPAEDALYVEPAEPAHDLPQDEKAERKARREAAIRAYDRERNDLVTVLASESGQRFILNLLEQCHVLQSSIQFGRPDASAFQEGKRAVGLWLLDRLQRVDAEAYPKLLIAQVKRKRVEAATTASELASLKS